MKDQPDIDDIFASLAPKYEFLFGLPHDSNILFIGHFNDIWVNDFNCYFRNTTLYKNSSQWVAETTSINLYDLILINPNRNIKSKKQLSDVISHAEKILKPNGTLILIAANKYSFDSIKRNLRGKKGSHGFSSLQYHNALTSAGLKYIDEFLTLPSINSPIEFISSKNGKIDLRIDARKSLKLLSSLNLYRFIHSGYYYIASTSTRPFSLLLENLKNILDGSIHNSDLKIEKFNMRRRGALLIILRNIKSDKSYVARIAASEDINAVLSRNMIASDKIHKLPTISNTTSEKVPRILKNFDLRGAQVYIEEKKPGVLAWTIENKPGMDKKIYSEAYQFIHQFNLETREQTLVTDNTFDELLGKDLTQMENAFANSDTAVTALKEIRRSLYKYFINKIIYVVMSHGDYGYGNILCNENDGRILAVIDWDTYVEYELPGVDFLHLRLQKYRAKLQGGLCSAVRELKNAISIDSTFGGSLTSYIEDDFDLTNNDLIVYACISSIRYIKRSLPYNREFINDYSDNTDTLVMISTFLKEIIK